MPRQRLVRPERRRRWRKGSHEGRDVAGWSLLEEARKRELRRPGSGEVEEGRSERKQAGLLRTPRRRSS